MTIKEILKAKAQDGKGSSVAQVYKVGERVEREALAKESAKRREAELAKRKEIDKAWREHRRA